MCLNTIKRLQYLHKQKWLPFGSVIYQTSLSCHRLSNKYNNCQQNYCQSRDLSNNTYDWLKSRGILKTCFPEKDDINRLISTKHTIYAGFDATYDSLHVGNLLVIIALLHLQRCGHRIVVVIGDATARIGDPSGKTEERPMIDNDLIGRYASSIEKSIERIFDNHKKYFWKKMGRNDKLEDYIICRNSQWYNDINVIDFMSNFGRHLRISTMMGKTIRDRLDTTGLCFSEFSYQAFQSYDWLYLLQKYGTDIQLGGVDQTVNIHNGHDLIKRLTQRQAFGLFVPILTNEDGKKFGKSEGKAIYLNENRTSAFALYQFFQRLTDQQVLKYFKIFSFRSDSEVEQMFQKQLRSPKPWYLQEKLAEDVILLVHGEVGLSSAKRTTESLFKRDINLLAQLSQSEINDVFEGTPVLQLIFNPDQMTVLELAMKSQCFVNELDALRMIKSGGLYINYSKVCSPQQIVTQNDILANSITLVSVGKRKHHIVKWY